MGLQNELPTKLDYETERSIPVGLHNVLDFQRLSVRLWNQPNHTARERRLFEKLMQWNNVLVARKSGYVWCGWCKDRGYRYLPRGIVTCECAATGHAEMRRLKFRVLGRRAYVKDGDKA
ncbi:hypothetical protein N007_05685 [Alicyclobacillus acidoterrestris ATCC 49025]|nr:hypothetical protein N007_05685 [Alicyclobacillus acidoterrestris ATCC 49025]